MNFLDAYDIAPRASTPNSADADAPPPPSLNEEVNEVIGQLGRFWGGFRKQSQTALQAARKDFGEVVVQAQKELAKFTAVEEAADNAEGAGSGAGETSKAGAEAAGSADAVTAGTSATTADGSPSSAVPESAATAIGTTEDTPRDTTNTSTHTRSASLSAQNLFARLQSALPPAVVATVQTNLASVQTNLASVQTNIAQTDLAGLRTTLIAELSATRAQAEDLALRSEARLRDAVREAGDVLRDAVKVVPPEEADGGAGSGVGVPLLGSTPGLAWDGADMWMLPGEGSAEGSRRTSSGSRGGGGGAETQSAVATRAEALLRRLSREPDIVRHDPEAEEGVRERYSVWRAAEVDGGEGGIEGAEWALRIEKARADPVDGTAVTQLEATLVPSEMTKDAFWLRFFFRTHQIRVEEEKRKALLQSTADTDEDFSWEDDEEDDASPASKAPTTQNTSPETAKLSVPAKRSGHGSNSPGRVGSADSFDVVSASSVAGDAPPVSAAAEKKTVEAEDGDDSDWE